MTDRLSTGVPIIDRYLSGGIPTGRVLVLDAPPESQSQLFLRAAARAADTLFISTSRSAESVQEDVLAETGTRTGAIEVDARDLAVDPTSSFDATALATDPQSVLEAVPESGYVIVDAFDDVEALDRSEHKRVLTRLAERARARDSIVLLHCARQDDRTAARRRTLHFADVVWTLHLTVTTLSVETRLTVTKMRDGRAHLEPIKLKLTDEVTVDTSRDIS